MAMQPHKIILDVKTDGKITGEIKGVSGPQCAPLSEWLDELGAVIEDRKTMDFSRPNDQNITLNR